MQAPSLRGMAEGEKELQRHLAQTLLSDIDAITGRVVADICAHSPAYASGRPVALSDLRAICRNNLVLALEDFGGLPASGDDFAAAALETGRRRAKQGMPLDTVLMAYRRGGRVLWQAMTTPLRGRQAPEQDLVLEVAGALWETIDRFSTLMADAYRLTQLELHHRQGSRRGALFEALLDGRGSDPTVAAAAAAALGIPLRDRYAVVAVDQDPLAPTDPEPALQAAGMWSFWRPRGERNAGIVRLAATEPAELAAVLRNGRVGTAGISPPFSELADANTALRLAERSLRTLPPGSKGVAELDDRLVEAVLSSDPEIADRLVTRYLNGMADSGSDGPVLLETLRIWLESGCSAADTAQQMYCHRNTILNRMARIAQLTGWPVESGEARLGWALALRAAQVPR